uniref:Major facilitator superfamily (MFS) profile domain-containing protein n=1 Tax=Lepeophtheirus salmonis TaxID=72036 RepID=A0A0K2UYI8_LEPSM
MEDETVVTRSNPNTTNDEHPSKTVGRQHTFSFSSVDADEENSKLILHENVGVELPSPPDGGWGWVIVFASFVCNLVLDGICYTFGVLMEPLVNYYDSSRSNISIIGSLLCGMYLTSGPIVGGLVNKYGCRPVCMTGSLIACIGLAASTLSEDIPTMMFTYGIIGGIGLGLVYLPAVVAVGYYFEKKRALATGISVCGSGVGTFLFAPFATYLVSEMGWKGANLIFAGLCFNCAVAGALMRPLELVAVPNVKNEDEAQFVVQLPDGTHHLQMSRNSTMHSINNEIGVSHYEISASINIPQLPTITEQSVTAQQIEERKTIQEVFPEIQQQEELKQQQEQLKQQQLLLQQQRARGQRLRTLSENPEGGNKFTITPVKEGSIPRNSSAPHFVDPFRGIPRNLSNPGLGKSSKVSGSETFGSHLDSPEHTIFSHFDGSNSTIYLQPGSSAGNRPQVRPLYRKDIFYSGSVLNLPDNQNQNIPTEDYRQSVLSIPRHSRRSSQQFSIHRGSIMASHLSLPPAAVRKMSVQIEDNSKPMINVIKEMINYHLLSNPRFLFICMSNVFAMLGFYVPFVFLPDMAVSRGVERESANILISIIGISNTFGRVLAGWFSDFEFVNSLVVTNIALFLSGISVLLLPVFNSYTAYAIIALLFGFFVAAYVSLTSIVLVDLMGLDNLTSSFGLLVLFRGISSMFGPPLAGAVFDATHSYETTFFMAGGFLILSGFVSTLADIYQRVELRKAKRVKSI